MKRVIIPLVIVCLAVLAFAGVADAAKKGTYFPGGSKLEITVDASNNVTVSWPAVVGDFDYYAAGYASKKAGTSGSYTVPEGAMSYTISGLSSGKWEILVGAQQDEFPYTLDTLKAWVVVP